MHQALAGQRGAYAQLVEAYYPRVTAFCWAKLGRHDAVPDVVQETFLRALRQLHALKHPERFEWWLHGIALRVCHEWRKAASRSPISLSESIEEGAILEEEAAQDGNPQQDLAVSEAQRHLVAGIEALPPKFREVIHLQYMEELSHRKIADVLNLSLSAVNARLIKARRLLRKRLGSGGVS